MFYLNSKIMKTMMVNAKKVSVLKKSIIEEIARDYVGYTIKSAYKADLNKAITYDVNLVKGTQTVFLSYDKNGVFIEFIEPQKKHIIKLMPIAKIPQYREKLIPKSFKKNFTNSSFK